MISINDQNFCRFAIYFKPQEDSALAEFEREWFGTMPDQIVASPKRYGLHATLKAPFRLNDQRTYEGLKTAIKYLAGDFTPVDVGPLIQKQIGGFLALVPKTECPDLNPLAFDWVRLLDAYRAPADRVELERRRAVGLNNDENEMLQKWGYPYVDKCFRFHITLTGKLSPKERDSIQPTLDELLKPVLKEPLMIKNICLVGDPGNGEPFRLLERFSLTG